MCLEDGVWVLIKILVSYVVTVTRERILCTRY